MSPLQNLQFHQRYDQLQRAQREKIRELTGEDPRARQLRAARPARGNTPLAALLRHINARLSMMMRASQRQPAGGTNTRLADTLATLPRPHQE